MGRFPKSTGLAIILATPPQDCATSLALDFTYDNVGRLTEEKRDGVATDYTYNANGSRTAVSVGGVQTIVATYDAQDRIQPYGSQTYRFTPNGDLLTRTSGTTLLTLTYEIAKWGRQLAEWT